MVDDLKRQVTNGFLRGRGWLLMMAVGILMGSGLAGCVGTVETELIGGDREKVAGTVQLKIDFQSDRELIAVTIPCSADSTVFSILQRAQNLGDLEFKASGMGTPVNVFVSSIAGVDGLGGNGDNWIFLVNGELGSQSSALSPVKPGDDVTWSFGKYQVK